MRQDYRKGTPQRLKVGVNSRQYFFYLLFIAFVFTPFKYSRWADCFSKEYIMSRKIDKIKPAVDKSALIFLAGFVWVAVGTMFLFLSYTWLNASQNNNSFLYSGMGVAAALVIHHFGFLKIVDKNLGRILPMEGKKCVFSFMTWKSYIIVGIMATMGILLRHSTIPKTYLSVLYIGIGLSLILSSVRYLKVLLSQIKN